MLCIYEIPKSLYLFGTHCINNFHIHVSFSGKLAYPQVSLNSTSALRLSLGTRGMKVRSKCSVVLVAGPALNDIHRTMWKIDYLGQDMMMILYAVVLLVHGEDIIPNTYRHLKSPPVVSIQCVQFFTLYSNAQKTQ